MQLVFGQFGTLYNVEFILYVLYHAMIFISSSVFVFHLIIYVVFIKFLILLIHSNREGRSIELPFFPLLKPRKLKKTPFSRESGQKSLSFDDGKKK